VTSSRFSFGTHENGPNNVKLYCDEEANSSTPINLWLVREFFRPDKLCCLRLTFQYVVYEQPTSLG
jgi:hypothetical protein